MKTLLTGLFIMLTGPFTFAAGDIDITKTHFVDKVELAPLITCNTKTFGLTTKKSVPICTLNFINKLNNLKHLSQSGHELVSIQSVRSFQDIDVSLRLCFRGSAKIVAYLINHEYYIDPIQGYGALQPQQFIVEAFAVAKNKLTVETIYKVNASSKIVEKDIGGGQKLEVYSSTITPCGAL